MDALNEGTDAPAMTKAVARPSAEEMIRQRLVEQEAERAVVDAEYAAEREQFVRDFPALFEKKRAEIGDQVRMTLDYLNDHYWPGNCAILNVVEGYTPITYRRWFATHTYYEQQTRSLAACPLELGGRLRPNPFLASNGEIYRWTTSRYSDERRVLLTGHHDINSSDVSSDRAYWPSGDDSFAQAILDEKTDELVRALKKVRHENLT